LRYFNGEPGALSFGAVYFQGPAVPLHDGFAQHQAEPSAGFTSQARPPGFGKGLKQHGLQVRENADTVVAHVDAHTP